MKMKALINTLGTFIHQTGDAMKLKVPALTALLAKPLKHFTPQSKPASSPTAFVRSLCWESSDKGFSRVHITWNTRFTLSVLRQDSTSSAPYEIAAVVNDVLTCVPLLTHDDEVRRDISESELVDIVYSISKMLESAPRQIKRKSNG